jgi:hypothetical protein
MTTMTTNMNGVYTNHLGVKRGRDKGTYTVYHIYVPSKHRGIHQGYIGRSKLDLLGIRKRYYYEVHEAFSKKYSRKRRYVHDMIRQYADEVVFRAIATGLTLEEAKQLEKALRPNKEGVFGNRFNWNISSGG